eukprot:Seg3738.3 transcript_id=Seg3738.3/GoldUCD/mRNA.D3Y31 product="Low density lipoprotein receptor adapter protein 1-A" protein_id=Seg3738.3/GoldUCD/D3Y31
MNVINRVFESTCRKLGLRKVYYKKRDVCFRIKAMGLTGMPVSGIDKINADEAIGELTKIWDQEAAVNVVITISATKGLRIKDKKGTHLLKFKIWNIANCTIDEDNPEVFVFMARQGKSTNCHAFYCKDKAQAEAICLAMSNAFHSAFETWVKRNGMPSEVATCDISQKWETESADNGQDEDLCCSDDVSKTGKSIENNNRPNGPFDQPTACAANLNEYNRTPEASFHDPKQRKLSIMSDTSAFSFNSQANEIFTTLLTSDGDCQNPQTVVILRPDSRDWDKVQGNEEVLSFLEGDEVIWEDNSEC